MSAILVVALGGAIGSVLRYVVGHALLQSTGAAVGYGTFVINVSGGFALGLLARLASPPNVSHFLFLALTVGLCGGYTTFSTFTLEMFTMVERGQGGRALAYALASVLASYVALWGGYALARLIRPLP